MNSCILCDKTVISRGLCKSHYYSMRRAYSLSAFKKKEIPLRDRLMSKFAVAQNGCWLWTGVKNDAGYPMIWKDGKAVRAHREIYKLFKNDLTDELMVCHKCDIPSCVNPEHLFIGTHLDNNRDAKSKLRNAYGEKHGKARLTKLQIIEICNDKRKQKEIAMDFGVCQSHISRIKSGLVWME